MLPVYGLYYFKFLNLKEYKNRHYGLRWIYCLYYYCLNTVYNVT